MSQKRVNVFFLVLLISQFLLLPAASSMVVRSPWFIDEFSPVSFQSSEPVRTTQLSQQLGLDEARLFLPPEAERVVAAIANRDYPLTPGDLLQLSYVEGKTTTTLQLRVSSESNLSIPNFGVIAGKGKTLSAVIHEIEALVSTYLPFATPQVTLLATGMFSVHVKGEVTVAEEVPAWGLSRLSSTVMNATPYASARKVLITDSEGQSRSYDLYQALQEGDVTQNPLLKNGDVVTFLPAERIITLNGEVQKPGIYQLTSGETLRELLERYGRGVLPQGDSSAVIIQRFERHHERPLQVYRVDSEVESFFQLQNLDTVRVEPLTIASEAVVIEGAVTLGEQLSSTVIPASSSRFLYQFYPGESVWEMVRALKDHFSILSDLSQTYLQRGSTLIPIDAQALLSGSKEFNQENVTLQGGDKFIVPFSQLFVTVSGGVVKPGLYPYIPGKDSSYYINVAGGVDRTKNRSGKYNVYDKSGAKVDKNAPITPESTVHVELTTLNALSGQQLTNAMTVVTLASSILALVISIITLASGKI